MFSDKALSLTIALLGFSSLSGCNLTPQPNTYQVTETEVNWITTGTLNRQKLVYESLPDANPATFLTLSKKFGTDGEYVFYSGTPIPLANGKTFRLLSDDYGVDDRFVFLRNYILEGASPEGFKVIYDKFPSSYAKNGKAAYYNHVPFTLCDEKSFRVDKDDEYWATDNQCAYFEGKAFVPADISNFETISFDYAKDSRKVYYEGTVIEGADSDSFERVYRSNIDGKDKFGCYIGNQRVSCDTTKDDSIYSGVNTDTIGTQEGFSKAVDTITENLKTIKRTRKEIATQNAERVKKAIINMLGDNLLTPNLTPDQQQIPSDYYYTLIPTLSGYSLTYQVRSISSDGVTVNMYSPRVNEVMKQKYNTNSQLISETRTLISSGYVTKYIGVKCERQLGDCEEKFISGRKKDVDRRSVKVSYKNGVWERKFIINNNINQEYRIYDSYGFEVYVATYFNNELRSEYIRKGFRPTLN